MVAYMQASKPEIFNRDEFEELCRAEGLDRATDRARALGVHLGTLGRIQRGELRPGLGFANKCRRVFGLEAFDRLFPLPEHEEVRS